MYVAIYIRSNIFFIKRFNWYFNDFEKYHNQTLKTLLKYIRFILNFDIIYDENLNRNENIIFKFETFSNSNYIANKFNRKSIFKYVYMFEKNIAWINRKQKLIITSIIKTKYITLSTCVKKIINNSNLKL